MRWCVGRFGICRSSCFDKKLVREDKNLQSDILTILAYSKQNVQSAPTSSLFLNNPLPHASRYGDKSPAKAMSQQLLSYVCVNPRILEPFD